jgi:hypothetical protein
MNYELRTHAYVDMTTDEQPYFYYDPASHDTFDYRGRMVNHALIMNNGEYTIDETRLMNEASTSEPETKMTTGDSKMKQKGDKLKEKTDTSKMKMDNNKMKVKIK